MKPGYLVVPILLGCLLSSGALADNIRGKNKAACLAAASSGQRFLDAHKLVEAREQLRVCAAAQCPAIVQNDCVAWLARAEAALPGVVITAKSGAGADLTDVRVSVDGQLLVSRLDGQAVAMNAGAHAFHFESADGHAVDQQVIVKEGEKHQAVAAVMGPVPLPIAVTPVVPAPSRPQSLGRTMGWITGGVGVVGLGLGTAFGLVAAGDKGSAHCSNNVCDPGTLSGMRSAALASTVGFIAGGVLLAGGAALILLSPPARPGAEHSPAVAMSLLVAPTVTPNGAQLVAKGSFQ